MGTPFSYGYIAAEQSVVQRSADLAYAAPGLYAVALTVRYPVCALPARLIGAGTYEAIKAPLLPCRHGYAVNKPRRFFDIEHAVLHYLVVGAYGVFRSVL